MQSVCEGLFIKFSLTQPRRSKTHHHQHKLHKRKEQQAGSLSHICFQHDSTATVTVNGHGHGQRSRPRPRSRSRPRPRPTVEQDKCVFKSKPLTLGVNMRRRSPRCDILIRYQKRGIPLGTSKVFFYFNRAWPNKRLAQRG